MIGFQWTVLTLIVLALGMATEEVLSEKVHLQRESSWGRDVLPCLLTLVLTWLAGGFDKIFAWPQ